MSTGGHRSAGSRWLPLWAALATLAVVAGVVTASLRLGDDPDDTLSAAPLPVSATVVQLRRDEVADRVEIALTNDTGAPVQVEAVRLRAPGFTGAGWVRLDYPLPPGGPVNFITAYGDTRCPPTGAARLGPVRVDVRWHTDADLSRQVGVLTPTASRGLLTRILRGDCREKLLGRQVQLAFGPTWRTEGRGSDIRLHTTVRATLTAGSPPRDVTQVSGSVLYGLAPDGASPPTPLARLDGGRRTADVPVVVTQARCTGHAKGEVKQPYLFLVWLGDPGADGTAVEVPVTAADRRRLRAVCAF